MSDEEAIREAVMLADGWGEPDKGGVHVLCDDSELVCQWPLCQHDLDALAAQLVRQMDALGFPVLIDPDRTEIEVDIGLPEWCAGGPDRTMNTIRAIVDSGVLK